MGKKRKKSGSHGAEVGPLLLLAGLGAGLLDELLVHARENTTHRVQREIRARDHVAS